MFPKAAHTAVSGSTGRTTDLEQYLEAEVLITVLNTARRYNYLGDLKERRREDSEAK
jgi:hypothetical protein